MGNCGATPLTQEQKNEQKNAKLKNRKLDELNAQDNEKNELTMKLLLLGAGESGKSTVFKQMKMLYGVGFSDDDRRDWIPKIQMGMVLAIKHVCLAATRLGLDTHVNVTNRQAFADMSEANERGPFTAAVAAHIKALWGDAGIAETWDRRSEYQVIESNEHYFKQVDAVSAPGYLPTDEDILASRVRTCGIVEEAYEIENVEFIIIDVGGQNNERKKWIHCFDNVNAVIFVAALSEFDQMMFEDETQNRMVDTLQLFDGICNSRWFQKTAMILFLNKRDVFRTKIQKKAIPTDDLWKDYKGKPNDYDDGVAYFQQKFFQKNNQKGKDIYMHITCATDSKNVKVVFDASKDIILKFNLEGSGFM